MWGVSSAYESCGNASFPSTQEYGAHGILHIDRRKNTELILGTLLLTRTRLGCLVLAHWSNNPEWFQNPLWTTLFFVLY
jgi:hypothetical protein